MEQAGLAAARRRRRWSTALAAVVIPAAAFVSAGTATQTETAADVDLCCAQVVPAPPTALHTGSLIVAAAESSRAMVRNIALPVGVAAERGLQVETVLAERAISATFPQIHSMIGVRPDSLHWHPDGLALDVMVPDYGSAAGKALGDRILAYVLANARRFDLNHVIWRQVLYFPNGSTQRMPDYGGDDANHYTHVHVATNGDGYPTGTEGYFMSALGPMLQKGAATATFVDSH
ncbi:MAG: hypothetical protein P4L86_04340 [Mycobacterium sp.]|nr:hypothetical protein [Mycobacterium sp.]